MKPDPSTLQAQLDQAWTLRLNQQIDECRLLLNPIRNELGLTAQAGPEILSGLGDERRAHATSYLLLCASLARAEGRYGQAKEWISMVDGFYHRSEWVVPYHLALQKGLTHFVDGDYSQALEQFLLARSRAQHPTQALVALANAVLCMENLGLPFEQTLQEFRTLFGEASQLDASLIDLRNQLEALEMRRAFRCGDVATAFARSVLPPVNQATYYRLWLSELPFHRFHSALAPSEMECFLVASPYFHQKSYRLRTLQGLVHDADREGFRPNDWADRLYLWVWRWLADSTRFPAARVTRTLDGVNLESLAESLTAEDAQMFRNALLWLALFLPSRTGPLRRLAMAVRTGGQPDYPWFDLEFQLVQVLVSFRDGQGREAEERLGTLASHPLWNSADLLLPEVVRSLVGRTSAASGPLQKMAGHLKVLCHLDPTPAALTVDLGAFRITRPSGEAVLSEALCLGLELMHAKPCVEVEEFALVCFGITRFEPEIHNAKVFNLLARMKALEITDLRFQIKSGRIYAQGPWEGVTFVRPETVCLDLENCPEWAQIFARRQNDEPPENRWVKPSVALKQAQGQGELTRDEIERMTGKSRSTATRILNRWLKDGVVRRVGKAKNTRYVWVGPKGGHS